jgi:hypothetical protein
VCMGIVVSVFTFSEGCMFAPSVQKKQVFQDLVYINSLLRFEQQQKVNRNISGLYSRL